MSAEKLLVALLIRFIKLYRFILSPWLGNSCRFYPSCSHYSEEALRVHGLFYGSYLTARRLLSCHPFHAGGIDPIPPTKS